MKQPAASTLSQHLLREADRFLFYPQPTRRDRTNVAAQRVLNTGLRRLVEWRKTFAPKTNSPIDESWSSGVMLDQMYCRHLLLEIPGIVERTRALRELTLSDVSDSEFVYLREAANCYIFGLSQASVALSRAAVDTRLREATSKFVGKDEARQADLIKLINDFSDRFRLLSKEGRQRAHTVRLAANEVLHNRPTDHATALTVFETAREVVVELLAH